MSKALHGISQAIHQDHFDPPVKFFLNSTVVWDTEDQDTQFWCLRLIAVVDGTVEAWICTTNMDELPAEVKVLSEGIEGGMLHVNIKGQGGLRSTSKLELQFLQQGDEPISIHLNPAEDQSSAEVLLEAAFSLLARKPAKAQPDKAEMRKLRNELDSKDEEIATLQAKVASLKASAARANTNDPKKKPQPSPKKPVGASTLQPNAKRRKAVADEFAGSDCD